MAILAINRYFVGNPNIVGIVADDDLAAITTAGYWALPATIASIEALQNGSFEWTLTDMALIYYATAQIGLFSFDATTNAFVSLPPGSDVVTAQEVQQAAFNHGIDTGVADDYEVALSPAISGYTDGLLVSFTPLNDNTNTTPSINVNGLGGKVITRGGIPVEVDDIDTNTIAYLIFSDAADEFTLLNPFQGWGGGGGVTAAQVQQSAFNVGSDSGAADAYVVTMTPPISSYTDGLIVVFHPTNISTSANPTVDVDGMGAALIQRQSSPAACMPGDITPTTPAYLMYNTSLSGFILLNPAVGFTQPAQTLLNSLILLGEQGGSAADNYVFNYPLNYGAAGAYQNGMVVLMQTAFPNTVTNPQIEISSHGAVPIARTNGDLVVGDILANIPYLLMFNAGTNQFMLLNPSAGPTITQIQDFAFTVGIDSGVADAYVVTLTPPLSAYTQGMVIIFSPNNTNTTTTPTLDAAGGTPWNIIKSTGALVAGDMVAGKVYMFMYVGANFLLMNPTTGYGGGVTATQVQQSAFNHGAESGVADAYVVTLSPAIGSYTEALIVTFVPNNTNLTTVPTIDVNGAGATLIIKSTGAVAIGDLFAGVNYMLMYSGGNFILMNPTTGY